MKGPIDWKRLARHFAGEASPKEKRELNAWIKADPSRRLWVEQLRRVWELSQKRPGGEETPGGLGDPSTETDRDWERLQKKLGLSDRLSDRDDLVPERSPREREQEGVPALPQNEDRRSAGHRNKEKRRRPSHSSRRRQSWRRESMIGLVVCLLVAGVATAVSSFVGGGQSEVGSVSSLREVATDPGERATIRMTDGTQVTLNVDSRLRIADESDSARRVFLEGEAYFDVASGERPFIVHVKEAMVNVHGTAFDVKSYPEERQVQVAVAEGVVSLHPDQQTSTGTRLTKGQLGHISGKGSLVATEKVDVKKYLGWTEDQIVFEDASLLVVARRLARWYGMSFEINDPSIETLRLTARLNSASMRDVMDVVSTTLGICYEVREDRVLLKQAGNCPESNAPGKKTLGSGSPEA